MTLLLGLQDVTFVGLGVVSRDRVSARLACLRQDKDLVRWEVLKEDQLSLLVRAPIQVNHLHLLRPLLLLQSLHLHALKLLFSSLLHFFSVDLELRSVRDIESFVHFLLEELVLWTKQAFCQLCFPEVRESQLALRLGRLVRLVGLLFLECLGSAHRCCMNIYLAVFGALQSLALVGSAAEALAFIIFIA